MELSPATQQSFGDGDELGPHFEPGYNLYAVTRYRDRYKLTAFDFERANGNILALPIMLAAAFVHRIC